MQGKEEQRKIICPTKDKLDALIYIFNSDLRDTFERKKSIRRFVSDDTSRLELIANQLQSSAYADKRVAYEIMLQYGDNQRQAAIFFLDHFGTSQESACIKCVNTYSEILTEHLLLAFNPTEEDLRNDSKVKTLINKAHAELLGSDSVTKLVGYRPLFSFEY